MLRAYAHLLRIILGSIEKAKVPMRWSELLEGRTKDAYRLVNLLEEVADETGEPQTVSSKTWAETR